MPRTATDVSVREPLAQFRARLRDYVVLVAAQRIAGGHGEEAQAARLLVPILEWRSRPPREAEDEPPTDMQVAPPPENEPPTDMQVAPQPENEPPTDMQVAPPPENEPPTHMEVAPPAEDEPNDD